MVAQGWGQGADCKGAQGHFLGRQKCSPSWLWCGCMDVYIQLSKVIKLYASKGCIV